MAGSSEWTQWTSLFYLVHRPRRNQLAHEPISGKIAMADADTNL